MSRPSIAPLLGLGVLSLVFAHAAEAQKIGPGQGLDPPRDLRVEVGKLLKLGWQASFNNYVTVRDQYDLLQQIAPGDGRLTRAYGLVLIRQRKFGDARKEYATVVARDKAITQASGTLFAWKAHIWLAMLTKDYSTAVAEMHRFVQKTRDNDGELAEARTQRIEAARFLGRMYGFLERPAGNAVNATVVGDGHRQLTAEFEDAELTAFNEGRDDVLQRFDAMSAQRNVTRQDTKEKEEQRKKEALVEMKSQREESLARLASFQNDRDEIINEGNASLEQLDQEERPLTAALTQLDRQVGLVQRELLLVENERIHLSGHLEDEDDPILRDRLRANIARLGRLGFRYASDLRVLRQQAGQIAAQRAAVLQRRSAVQSQGNRLLGQLGDSRNQVQKSIKRLNAQLTRLASGPEATGTNSRVLAIGAKARALTTYESLTLEFERQRILDSFK